MLHNKDPVVIQWNDELGFVCPVVALMSFIVYNRDRYLRVKRKIPPWYQISSQPKNPMWRSKISLQPLGVRTAFPFLSGYVMIILGMWKSKQPNPFLFPSDKSCQIFSHRFKGFKVKLKWTPFLLTRHSLAYGHHAFVFISWTLELCLFQSWDPGHWPWVEMWPNWSPRTWYFLFLWEVSHLLFHFFFFN